MNNEKMRIREPPKDAYLSMYDTWYQLSLDLRETKPSPYLEQRWIPDLHTPGTNLGDVLYY